MSEAWHCMEQKLTPLDVIQGGLWKNLRGLRKNAEYKTNGKNMRQCMKRQGKMKIIRKETNCFEPNKAEMFYWNVIEEKKDDTY